MQYGFFQPNSLLHTFKMNWAGRSRIACCKSERKDASDMPMRNLFPGMYLRSGAKEKDVAPPESIPGELPLL
jgi:hypothetical protein